MSANSRVSGHELDSEGAAFVPEQGSRRFWRRVRSQGVGGVGKARCSCGATSEVLDSGAKRKAWHRQHKAEVTQ